MATDWKKYGFLFEELVKRDFKNQYRGAVLGVVWSVLSPLLTLLVMRLVFTQFFGHSIDHYTTFLFCGTLAFSFFSDCTSQGMFTLRSNVQIYSRVNMPRYILCMVVFNIGLGLFLAVLLVLFRDIQYLWNVIVRLLMYLSAVFYNVNSYPPLIQRVFLLNPVYCFIRYFRQVVLDGVTPSLEFHLLILAYTLAALALGYGIYWKFKDSYLSYFE